MKEAHEAARTLGQKIEVLPARNGGEIDAAFDVLKRTRANALLIVANSLFFSRRVQIVTLAARLGIPAIYTSREYAEAGGLMSYGTILADAYRQAGGYAARILQGVKPADLPVIQSTKFEMVVNMNTARASGIEIPAALLVGADEVIE